MQAVELIDTMFDDVGPGIAVASFSEGIVLNKYSRGLANLDSGQRIDEGTAFHVASISKQFTAYAAAQLISEMRLKLEDRLGNYLYFVTDNLSRLTIAQLIYHTSGLSDQWVLLNLAGRSDGAIVTTENINQIICKHDQLRNVPGSEFSYTNTGYTLLAQVIEVITGQSLDGYLQTLLFGPLKMSHTRFRSDPLTSLTYEAECYARQQDGTYKTTTPAFATVGATSLRSSISDVALWAHHLTSADNPASRIMHGVGSLSNGKKISYGFGLYHGTIDEVRTISHSGWDAEFSAHVMYLPELKIGAAAFSNGTQANLELVAASFLESEFSPKFVETQLRKKLSILLRGSVEKQNGADAASQKVAYGSLATGDVRLWEQSPKGQLVRGNAVQHAVAFDSDSYILSVSLTELALTADRLTISSCTQNQSMELPSLVSKDSQIALIGEYCFYSKELEVVHTIVGDEDKVNWLRPSKRPLVLYQLTSGVFFAAGYTLQISGEAMTIINARSSSIHFERIPAASPPPKM